VRLYKRKDFLNLPRNIIYSRVDIYSGSEVMKGLYCKKSNKSDMDYDWHEQDLLTEFDMDYDAWSWGTMKKRDSFQEFKADLNCLCRDGLYDDKDVFVVWDKDDVEKLANYLNDCLKNYSLEECDGVD